MTGTIKKNKKIFDILSPILFITLLGLAFLYEGLGLRYGREISYFIILVMPFFLFFIDLINKKGLNVPKGMIIIFSVFLIFTIASATFSLNIQRSFEYLLYYVSTFLLFLYVFNHKYLQKSINIFIFVVSFLFIGYSTFINYFLPTNWSFLIPGRGYQYVYAFYKTHNALGSLLLIPLMLSFSYFISARKKIYLIIFLIILPFFLLSYSRSSYLAFTLGGLILTIVLIHRRKLRLFSKMGGFVMVIFGLFLLFFVSTVNYKYSPSPLKYLNKFLSVNFKLNTKTFLSERNEYFRSAILSIKEKPFFGVGPANFIFASSKYARSPAALAETSDNIFLEIFSENGIFAGIVFTIMIVFLLTKSNKNSQALFITFVTMLLLFLTDSSQRYYSYYLLFFIIAGLLYEEKSVFEAKYVLFFVSLLLFITANCMFIGKYLYDHKNYKAAFYFYPLNQQIFEGFLTTVQFQKDNRYWLLYERLFNGDPSALTLISGINLYVKNNDKAYTTLKKINEYYPYSIDYLYVFKSTYDLETTINGKDEARLLADKYLRRLEEGEKIIKPEYFYGQEARNLCWFVYGYCPFDL